MTNWDEKKSASGGLPGNSEQEALQIIEEYRAGRRNPEAHKLALCQVKGKFGLDFG